MNDTIGIFIGLIEPVAWIAAGFPFLIALIVWCTFYRRYAIGYLAPFARAMSQAADDGLRSGGGRAETLDAFGPALESGPPEVARAWGRLRSQAERQFIDGLVPEAEAYFRESVLIALPGGRHAVSGSGVVVFILAALCLALPTAGSLLKSGVPGAGALFAGLCGASLTGLGHLLFLALDRMAHRKALEAWRRFMDTFDELMPVAGALAGPALLLKATEESRQAFVRSAESMALAAETASSATTAELRAATERITAAFTGFAEGGVLPALRESVQEIAAGHIAPSMAAIRSMLEDALARLADKQDQGMEEMTSLFAARLADTLETRLTELAYRLDSVSAVMEKAGDVASGQMESFQAWFESMASDLDAEYRALLGRINENLTGHLDRSSGQAAALLSEIAESLRATSSAMSDQLAAMTGEISGSMAALAADTGTQLARLAVETKSGLGELSVTTRNHLADLAEQTSAQFGALVDETRTQTAIMTTESQERLRGLILDLEAKLTGLVGVIDGTFRTGTGDLEAMIDGNRKVLEESAALLVRAADIQANAAESSRAFGISVADMTGTVIRFESQTQTFTQELLEYSQRAGTTQRMMAEQIGAAQVQLEETLSMSIEKYAQMSELISGMMSDITERMKDAMAGAGREVARGISQVTEDNAEAIAALTEQAQRLRDDYLIYFDRMENSTKTAMEDMDYQMHNLIGIMNDNVSALLRDTVEENASVLSQYKDQTTELLRAFEEQAMSINLYAKEINLDVNDLTTGIRGAVVEFTEKIQEGVRATIGEFDTGLSELTERLANTVESIRDAVENLPAALERD